MHEMDVCLGIEWIMKEKKEGILRISPLTHFKRYCRLDKNNVRGICDAITVYFDVRWPSYRDHWRTLSQDDKDSA